MVRVAALQMTSGMEPEANLEALATLAHQAAAQGAAYALSPEVSNVFAKDRDGLKSTTWPWENSPTVARCAAIARDTGIHLHVGSMVVARPGSKYANRSVLFGPDGAVNATYDKIHLFDATLPGDREYRESATYVGGDTGVVGEAAGMKLGLSICYDVRFPALHPALAEAGAEVITVPAAFTVPTGEAHWEILLRARAIETGCWVIAAAQAGHHENGRSTYGHSMIIDPWGKIVGQLGGERPGVLVVDIDLNAVAEARGRVPALANARQFSLSVNPTGAS
jgi:predicted amidohydrolase